MASNNIEIEAKVLLKRADYEKLKKNLEFVPAVKIQSNYYLDSNDRILKKYGMVLRLRTREGNAKLTLKAPLSEGLLEKNQSMTLQEATDMIRNDKIPEGEISDFLQILHIDPDHLTILAELTTERREGLYDGTSINISKNTYGDTVDYEIECDSDSKAKSERTLKELLDKFKIPFKLNDVSKEDRAISEALNSKVE